MHKLPCTQEHNFYHTAESVRRRRRGHGTVRERALLICQVRGAPAPHMVQGTCGGVGTCSQPIAGVYNPEAFRVSQKSPGYPETIPSITNPLGVSRNRSRHPEPVPVVQKTSEYPETFPDIPELFRAQKRVLTSGGDTSNRRSGHIPPDRTRTNSEPRKQHSTGPRSELR